MGSSNHIPDWLETLLEENFFNTCKIHENSKKNEKNMYCLDCCSSFCHNCIHLHDSHCYLQVYKNICSDAVQVANLEKQTDCASIQVYKCNYKNVVHLNSRKNNNSQGSGNNQCTCGHAIPEPYLYCSLSCKVKHSVTSECAPMSTSSSNKGRKNRRKGSPHRATLP